MHPKKGHPAIWPDRLATRLIRMFSYEGDLVLDPFLGSGTTVKVARELGREGIGYERELQYKPVIMERLGMVPEDADIEATMEAVRQQLGGDEYILPEALPALPTDRQVRKRLATKMRRTSFLDNLIPA